MTPKLFLTGGTGYIGGTVLDTIVTQHPEYEVTVLLRNQPENFTKLYPSINIVRGNYDSSDVLSDAASKADVVVHCGDSDHEPSIKALIAGLLRRSDPGFLIHLSGTGIVADWRDPTYLGKLNPKIWSDIDDLDETISRHDDELHRNVDKIIQSAAAEHGDKLKTAIMCPPDIYGPGRGPGRQQSVLLGMNVFEAKKLGATFYAGDGGNTRSWVHIEDLMQVYLKLIEAAVAGGKGADWGMEGYYFTSTQEASQMHFVVELGKILKTQGVLDTAEPKQVSLEQVDSMAAAYRDRMPKLGRYIFMANSRTRPHRTEKLFGYKPSAPSLWEMLESDTMAALKQ